MQKQNKFLFFTLSLFLANFLSPDLVAMKRKRPDDDKDLNPKNHKIRRIEEDEQTRYFPYGIPQRRPAQQQIIYDLSDDEEEENESRSESESESEISEPEEIVVREEVVPEEEVALEEEVFVPEEEAVLEEEVVPEDEETPVTPFYDEVFSFNNEMLLGDFIPNSPNMPVPTVLQSQPTPEDEQMSDEEEENVVEEESLIYIDEDEEEEEIDIEALLATEESEEESEIQPVQTIQTTRFPQPLQTTRPTQPYFSVVLPQLHPLQPPATVVHPVPHHQPPRIFIVNNQLPQMQHMVQVTVHSNGKINIQSHQQKIPRKTKETQEQKKSPQTKSQPKKKRIREYEKTLTDLPIDSITQIILFMLSPEYTARIPWDERHQVDVQEIMNRLRLVCQTFNTTIEHIIERNQLVKSIVQYIETHKELPSRTTLLLYFKLSDVLFDSSKQDESITFVIKEDDLETASLTALFLIFTRQIQESPKKSNTVVTRRLNILKELINWFILRSIEKYNAPESGVFNEVSPRAQLYSIFEELRDVATFAASQGDLESIEWVLNLFNMPTIADTYVKIVRNRHRYDQNRRNCTSLQLLHGQVLLQAAANCHIKIVRLFAKKLRGMLAGMCYHLDIIQQAATEEIRTELSKIIQKQIDELNSAEKKDELGAYFTIAAELNQYKLMKKIVQDNKKKIHYKHLTNALQNAMANKSDKIVKYLTKKKGSRGGSFTAIRNSASNASAQDLLIVAARNNYVRVIKFLMKSKKISSSILPELAPELLIIAAEHGSLDIVQFLLENIKPSCPYDLNFQKDAAEWRIRELKSSCKRSYCWMLRIPSPLELAISLAAEKGTRAETDEEKEKYKAIVAYLLKRNQKMLEISNFIAHATTSTPKNKEKRKKTDSDVEMEDPEEVEEVVDSMDINDDFIVDDQEDDSYNEDKDYQPSGSGEEE